MSETCRAASNQAVKLRETDRVEVISLIDNSVDFLSTIERDEVRSVRVWVKERKGEEWANRYFQLPLAEHGFSMLIRAFRGGNSHCVLFDTGSSREGVITNAKRMGISLSEIQSVVLSHGHYDHCGGLLEILKVINREHLPIIVHEDMFKMRGVVNPDGTIRKYPNFPKETRVKPARYIKTKQPYLLGDNTILVTGEIPRKTKFEKGFLRQRAMINGKWQPDPWVWDDRAIVINVKKKGLAILSGCAHAGIINTTLHAQEITGVTDIYALIGGFHLAGKEGEQRINQTLEMLKLLTPSLLAPSHCTGWRANHLIAQAMPQAFVQNSVGNLYQL
jgi:7,8-dihydropterin-6-yl-methyl-4-(beta-D-ribofuranosyl)aminobenzene 5'-phosphate synthase